MDPGIVAEDGRRRTAPAAERISARLAAAWREDPLVLEREDVEGMIVISQPAHAQVSRGLAEVWGNAEFGEVTPRAEALEAAGQHDLAWLTWETAPRLDPRTGRPYTFRGLPTMQHLGVWREAGKLALAYGRYTALLVSLHGSGLYERFHDYERDSPGEAAAARAYVEAAHKFEEELLDDLRRDPTYAGLASPALVDRNRRLLAAWDALSLAICGGFTGERRIGSVPTATGETQLTLLQSTATATELALYPWPFRTNEVRLFCEGRRLPGTFTDETVMREALARAPWVALRLTVRPKVDG